MKDYTSFRIGGPVSLMLFPETMQDLTEIFGLIRSNEIKPFILGRGTNLLINDKPLDIVVINTLKLNTVTINKHETPTGTEVIASAGIGLNSLAVYVYNNGLSGLEFAHGIPGTLGGAVKMNAGAYDSEINDVVSSISYITEDGEIRKLQESELNFGYRSSNFSNTSEIITSAKLVLQKSDMKLIKSKMDSLAERRQKSQPLDLPSAGSVFKKPEKGYAAELIEKAGLKGFTIGGAQVSQKHAGFIVNVGNAAFSDIIYIINHVQDEVYKLFNIELEPEIKIWI